MCVLFVYLHLMLSPEVCFRYLSWVYEVPSLVMSQPHLEIVRQNLAEVAFDQGGKHKQGGKKGQIWRRKKQNYKLMKPRCIECSAQGKSMNKKIKEI